MVVAVLPITFFVVEVDIKGILKFLRNSSALEIVSNSPLILMANRANRVPQLFPWDGISDLGALPLESAAMAFSISATVGGSSRDMFIFIWDS